MRPIQLILVVMAVATTAIFFSRLRSKLAVRVFFLVLVMTGVLLVMFPDFSSMMAHRLGVGRGVDLIIYLSLAGLGFVWLAMYTKMQSLESRLTELTRTIALMPTARGGAVHLGDPTVGESAETHCEGGSEGNLGIEPRA